MISTAVQWVYSKQALEARVSNRKAGGWGCLGGTAFRSVDIGKCICESRAGEGGSSSMGLVPGALSCRSVFLH